MRPGPLRIGQDFGPRYHVLTLLGSGGMGVVYQALDRELGVEIALKVLRAPARSSTAAMSVVEMQRRFKTELLLARKITHRNVIRIHDIGEIDGIRFISMPLVKGQDLATLLRGGALAVPRVLRYARQIAAGLVAVHAAGVIHRDLKPANLMIDDEDEALLMDFGIARSSAPAAAGRSMGGAVMGTAAYMAPEQARGEAVDERTDIYAFGLILYEMLYGPRAAVTMAEIVGRMKAAPQPDRQLKSAVPDALHAVVTRCLQPAARDRYQSAAALAEALNALSTRRLRPLAAAGRWRAHAAAALLLLALFGSGYWATTRRGTAALARGRTAITQSLAALNPGRLLNVPGAIAAIAAAVYPQPSAAAPAPPAAARADAARHVPSRPRQPDEERLASVERNAGMESAEDGRGEASGRGTESEAATSDADAGLAASYLAAADARAAVETPDATVAAIRRALAVSRHESVMLAAARVLLAVDRPDEARSLARELDARGGPARGVARLIEGEITYGTCRARPRGGSDAAGTLAASHR